MIRSDEGELGFWGRAIRRRWRMIVAVVLLGVAIVSAATLVMGTSYTATARLVVRDGDPTAEAQFLSSSFAQDAASRQLGYAPDVEVAGGTDGSILTVTARAASVAQAVEVANTYARTAIDLRARSAGEERARVAATFQEQIAEVDAERNALGTSPRRVVELDQQRAAYQQAAAAAQAAPPTPIPSLLAPAAPTDVTGSDPALYAAVAAVVALLAGLAAAGVAEHADPRVRGPEQAAAALGAPSFGSAPSPGDPSRLMRWWRRLLRLSGSGDAVPAAGTTGSEAYSLIRTRLQAHGEVKPHGSIQVVAADTVDASRAVAVGINLCLSFARSGHRSLLVCADFRQPDTCLQMLHLYTEGPGFGEVLAGFPPGDAVQTAMEPDMLVLPAGTVPAAPFDALSSDRFTDVLSEIRMLADVMVVLTPPLTAHPDGFAVAGHVDSRVVVASAAARAADLERVQRELERTGQTADAVVFARGEDRA